MQCWRSVLPQECRPGTRLTRAGPSASARSPSQMRHPRRTGNRTDERERCQPRGGPRSRITAAVARWRPQGPSRRGRLHRLAHGDSWSQWPWRSPCMRRISTAGASPRQRQALVLKYHADLSRAQIGAAMEISRGEEQRHTARALTTLRTCWSKGGKLTAVPPQAPGRKYPVTTVKRARPSARPKTAGTEVRMP